MSKSVRTGTILMATGLAAALLASCGAGEFEQAVLGQAEREDAPFSLPAQGTPVEQWDRVVIVCPYMYVPEEFDPDFAKAITNTDEFLDDSSQWLIFAQADQPRMLRLARDTVDFCSDGLSTDPMDSGQLWTATAADGRWMLTPVG